MELLVSTRNDRPEATNRRMNSSAPGMRLPSWMSTPSMSVNQDSMGPRSVIGPPTLRPPLSRVDGIDHRACDGSLPADHRPYGRLVIPHGQGNRPLERLNRQAFSLHTERENYVRAAG